jgi:hypothetical protein
MAPPDWMVGANRLIRSRGKREVSFRYPGTQALTNYLPIKLLDKTNTVSAIGRGLIISNL